ncbi:hypothetical protein COOONC_16535, partial [Cooperia oncophora]
ARMFSSHRVVVAEESARVRGRVACAQHSEPYILYCTENKSLACIQCFNERPAEDRHYSFRSMLVTSPVPKKSRNGL